MFFWGSISCVPSVCVCVHCPCRAVLATIHTPLHNYWVRTDNDHEWALLWFISHTALVFVQRGVHDTHIQRILQIWGQMLHLLVGAIGWMECMKCKRNAWFDVFSTLKSIVRSVFYETFFGLVYSLVNSFCLMRNNDSLQRFNIPLLSGQECCGRCPVQCWVQKVRQWSVMLYSVMNMCMLL